MQNYLKKDTGDTVKVEVKAWYTSKTLWFNLVSFVLSIIVLAQSSPLFMDKPEVLGVLATINVIGNTILRFISNDPLTFRK